MEVMRSSDSKKSVKDKSSEIKPIEKDSGGPTAGRPDGTEVKADPLAKNSPDSSQDSISDDIDTKLKDFDIPPDNNTNNTMWSLKLLSQHLMNALRAVVEYYSGLQLLSHNFEVLEPYKELIHHMPLLSGYRDNQPSEHPSESQDTCTEHMNELLGYLEEILRSKLREERLRHERGVCTFPYLWMLYDPGDEVYWNWFHSSKHWSSFIVEEVAVGVTKDNRVGAYKVWA